MGGGADPNGVAPFPWSDLPSVGPLQLQQSELLAGFERKVCEIARRGIELFSDRLEVEVPQWRLVSSRMVSSDRASKIASGHPLVVERADGWSTLLVVDFSLVLAAVDVALGESPHPRYRPLSSVEAGLVLATGAWAVNQLEGKPVSGAELATSPHGEHRAGRQEQPGPGDRFWIRGAEDVDGWLNRRQVAGQPLAVLVIEFSLPPCSGTMRIVAPLIDGMPNEAGGGRLGATLRTCVVELSAVLARLSLQRAQLEKLEIGAVLVAPELERFDEIDLAIGGTSLFVAAGSHTVGQSQLVIEKKMDEAAEPSQRRGSMMSGLNKNTPGFDAVPIDVDVLVGRVHLSLGELTRLGPGVVVVLDRALGSDVELVAGGATVASGELVEVGGSLGVRVVSVAP